MKYFWQQVQTTNHFQKKVFLKFSYSGTINVIRYSILQIQDDLDSFESQISQNM